ncbi:MAG: hypothetical protein E7103_00630 [Prevotella sp.]|jgi:hypothetical protein|nr:hypothetical protein [Prevotella sp.]
MKKLTMLVALTCATATITFAQKGTKEMKYRRSSLYTIMVPSDKLTGEAKEVVTATFDTLAIPDKYNDHNLKVRHIDLTKIEVTPEEVKAAEEIRGGHKKGIAGLAKKGLNFAKKAVSKSETGGMGGDEKVAKILKFFKENYIANKLIGKWYNESKTLKGGSHFNTNLITERGLFGASQEELNKYKGVIGGKNKIMDAAEKDLVPRTFVMVTSYAYQSSEEVAAMAAAGSAVAGGTVGAITQLTASAAAAVLKGYFITTTSYLFQLDWDEEKMLTFYEKYWNAKDTKAFDTDTTFQLKYVGKTSDFAPATLKLTLKGDEMGMKLISRATARATDASIAKLQKKYEVFKTLSVLNVSDDGSTMYAYVGKKEGVKKGDKFEVLEQEADEDGNITFKKIGTVKVAKGMIWDNRAGAGEKLEGEAETKEDDDDDDIAYDKPYTTFEGKPGKGMEMGGLWLRQLK